VLIFSFALLKIISPLFPRLFSFTKSNGESTYYAAILPLFLKKKICNRYIYSVPSSIYSATLPVYSMH
jgi:hypothetical protein